MPTTTPFDQLPDDDRPEPGTLLIEDQSLAHGFIQLPRQILWARNLSRDAKILYAVLLNYAWSDGHCFPGYARLCYDLDASENAVRKYMRELETVGLLSQKRRGLGKTNIYILHDLRTAKIEVQEPQKLRTSKSEVLDPAKSEVLDPAKSEVYLETVDLDTEYLETDVSKSRKAPPQRKNGPDGDTPTTQRSISRIRSVSLSDDQGDKDISQKPVPGKTTRRSSLFSGDMSPTAEGRGPQPIGATLGRRPGRPTADQAEVRRVIRQFIEDYGRELGDQAPKSSVTRVLNLMQEAGVNIPVMLQCMRDAKADTQRHTASIRGSGSKASESWTPKNKMGYFFRVLEDRLGLKEPAAVEHMAPAEPLRSERRETDSRAGTPDSAKYRSWRPRASGDDK